MKKSEGVVSKLPLFFTPVPAGFPSPADDYVERNLDLNELMISHPAATFFVRVSGNSMIDANIFTDDVLVVDRSVEPHSGQIILALVNREFTVKRFVKTGEIITLHPENPKYKEIIIKPDTDFEVWGVVTYIIHKAK